MWNFLYAIQGSNVIQGIYGGTEAAVKTEYLPINQRRQRQIVEQISEMLPHGRVAVFTETLVVETIDLSDLT